MFHGITLPNKITEHEALYRKITAFFEKLFLSNLPLRLRSDN
jgi:hypothetical protein